MAWATALSGMSYPDFASAGMNFAIGNMNRQRYASQVRHLRRREYQDMVFSMKKAGLNPMLASGATPGHSAGMMTNAPAGPVNLPNFAANKNSAASAKKTESETMPINLNQYLREADLQNLHATYDQMTSNALAARSAAQLNNEKSTSEKVHRLLMEKQGALTDVSAKETEQRIRNIELDAQAKENDPIYGDGLEGSILRRVEAYSRALQGMGSAANTASEIHHRLKTPDVSGGYETTEHFDASGARKGKTHRVFERMR